MKTAYQLRESGSYKQQELFEDITLLEFLMLVTDKNMSVKDDSFSMKIAQN